MQYFHTMFTTFEVLLPFMTLEYPLILKTNLKLFHKQYNRLIKKVFLTYERVERMERTLLPHPTLMYVYGLGKNGGCKVG